MNEQLIAALRQKLGNKKVLTGKDVQDRYDHIWNIDQPLQALAVVLPRTTQEVSQIMKICHDYKQPLIVHGGLTNLVGSTESSKEEVIISMEKMNAIEELDEKSRTMTVQAGVILENIQLAAKENNLLFPLNYGAKGSAQIGGAISTNAGGLRVFRFGMTRNLVLGLEAVLADGTIVSSLKKIIKDNSGYDLKQLFIGSEGTLGVVTKAVVKLVEAPKSRNSAYVGFNDYEKVVAFLKYMDSGLAGTLSGFELIWKTTYEAMTAPIAAARPPLPHDYNYYVLLESLGSHQENDHSRLQELLEKAVEEELILDAVMAHTESDLVWFWTMREDAHVFISTCNNKQIFDISLPIPLVGSMIQDMVEQLHQLPEVEKVLSFGHLADGNIHLIVGKSRQSEELIDQINRIIYEPLQDIGGSISAEHGIGEHKKQYLALCRTSEEIQLMRILKQAMDPLDLLNRGKILSRRTKIV